MAHEHHADGHGAQRRHGYHHGRGDHASRHFAGPHRSLHDPCGQPHPFRPRRGAEYNHLGLQLHRWRGSLVRLIHHQAEGLGRTLADGKLDAHLRQPLPPLPRCVQRCTGALLPAAYDHGLRRYQRLHLQPAGPYGWRPEQVLRHQQGLPRRTREASRNRIGTDELQPELPAVYHRHRRCQV